MRRDDVNEFRARAVPTVGCALQIGFRAGHKRLDSASNSEEAPPLARGGDTPIFQPGLLDSGSAPRARRESRLCPIAGRVSLRPVSPTGRDAARRRARSEAGLGRGRHFAATGTAIPGIFTLTAPRWLRLVM